MMSNAESIKRKAFINELCKIALSNGYSAEEALSLVKQASFVDECKVIQKCGSGTTTLTQFIKTAGDDYYTPPKWEGVSGFHKAVSEDPKTYESNERKGMMIGTLPTMIPVALSGMENFSEGMKASRMDPPLSEEAMEALRKATTKQINKKYLPYIIGTAIGGGIAGRLLFSDKYLNERGIKKGLLGGYSFNHKAQNKYL